MTPTFQLHLCDEVLHLDPLGAVYWAAQETLIVADLHFEKGSHFARRGSLLPPYDTRATLMRLHALMKRYRPKRVISLGDAFHDPAAEMRVGEEEETWLRDMMSKASWVWVLGNHDPAAPERFAAISVKALSDGPFTFRHEPSAEAAAGELAGHLHPCARIVSEGRSLRRRCFASNGERLILPALGAFTGGLNLLDPAFDGLGAHRIAFALGDKGVYPVAQKHLAPDQARAARAG